MSIAPNEYIFNIIDTNSNNNIDASELTVFMKNFYPELTENDAQNTINDIDTNGDGLISKNEFTSIISNDILPEDINNAYNALILNGENNIKQMIDLFLSVLKIEPLYNLSISEYSDLLYKMIGDSKESFINLWNFLQSNT
ncbi:ORF MSV097 putative calcium binding protein, similar to Atriplex numularia PRF:1906390A [Melanoplus sanguinipes entomopoxvirus]|uniref:ORF MSV097 putative calcium binding protein, similar to Atriplex numularia PRF:1906390A n=1 Tax=Melanoplus sanguinipes entomopoxvirus TaxID=83191 RepID=Q9YVZ5_MSEPV|nr:ORF MSV097 putative calcium binding protein, similar to Atriplex numularia PRF:1906390A [Melanoplus sanguinipes entomopoxvirus]AAC97646.1 ORF MSV097 putative calcium binding protein, similar to Atriplex numularia PRF:1906390A [Melanoplus sanguinipes entomopoxvirus 'O']